MRLRWLLAGILVAWLAAPLGCATRESRTVVYDRDGVTAFLREDRQGFRVMPRGFDHPIQISAERLVHILGAIDIRGREESLAGIRAAFEPDEIPDVAEGLSRALEQASPDQEVGVQVVRKEVRNLIFDRKLLTSFVAYARDDLLFLHVSRVDWEIPERTRKNLLPIPRVSEHPMKFQVVPSEGMYQEGMYAVSVDWQRPLFMSPVSRVDVDEERRERTILMETPTRVTAPEREGIPAELLPYLTPSQLRALADLEDARAAGSMSEGAYRRERERILAEAREESATSH